MTLDDMRRAIADVLEDQVREWLPTPGKYLLTFCARIPGDPEMDVLITQESDLDEIVELLKRSGPREAIGGGS